MSERDDYLFDPKAAPDLAVQALERALAPLAWRDPPMRAAPAAPLPGRRRGWPWLLAAALVVGAVVFAVAQRDPGLQPEAPPRAYVAGAQALRIPLGDLAEITLRPGSELQFVHWRAAGALFALRRGSLEARVAPPPRVQAGFFRVDTPVGRVVDQGCRYELVLHDDGRAHVRVTEGGVTFEAGERTVFVPAGAGTMVDAAGPATPVFIDASVELRKAVREYDALRVGKVGWDQRSTSVEQVLAAARAPRDSLVLWHLLRDAEPEFRKVAEAHLADLVGPPDGGKTKRDTFDVEEWLAFLRLAWQAGG